MNSDRRAAQLEGLAREAESLAASIRENDDATERRRRDAHRLREIFGVALVLSEGLATEEGNGSMLTIDGETGRVCYTVALDEAEIADVTTS